MNLGTISARGATSLAVPGQTVDVDDSAAIGFRTDGRLVVLHCTRTACELRDYRRDGRVKVLATLAGGRRISCHDVDGQLRFAVDGQTIFEYPKGRELWSLYRA